MTDDFADLVANAVTIDGPTDLTIACRDGRRFEFHRSVVCPQSHVLTIMCEIGMTEQQTGLIEHKVFDSDTVELMLQYAYAGAYVITKRPVPLSLLERKLEEEEKEAGLGGAVQKGTEKGVVEGDCARVSANENVLSDDLGIDEVGAADATAAAHDDGAVARETMTQAPRAETIRDPHQPGTLSTHVSNATLPWSDCPWLSVTDGLITNARVYGLADYYEMDELRNYALERFSSLVDQRRLEIWRENILEGLIDVVREVSARTAPGNDCLRTSFLKLIAEHPADLCTNLHFIRELGDSRLSDILADMLRAVAQQLRRDREHYISFRKDMLGLQSKMKEPEDFWDYCAPGRLYR
jgi:hypothetical protein